MSQQPLSELALAQLRGQMDPQTFDCWLGSSQLVDASNGVWTVAVVSAGARDWLRHRLASTIEDTVSRLAGHGVTLELVVAEHAPAAAAGGRDPALTLALLSFDPNSAEGGGYWQLGNSATWFWAAYLGAVAWRVYELVISGDRRRDKTRWTPPRRYSISKLARAVASGRDGRLNRQQIRGCYRQVGGARLWRPGAFDRLIVEGLARIEWHDAARSTSGWAWQPWLPGGGTVVWRSGLRLVYRLSVVARLPLLTPQQVARLSAEQQVTHERYLADRGLDVALGEDHSTHAVPPRTGPRRRGLT